MSSFENLVPELNTTTVKYDNIFGNIEEIVKAGKLLKNVCDARKDFLDMMASNQDY